MIEDWIKVRHLLIPAIELMGGTHTEDDIVTGLMIGISNVNAPNALKLWLARSEKAAIVTGFLNYPRLKFLHWWLAGGEMSEILAMERPITEWARSQGCRKASIDGRKGWERVLTEYQPKFSVLHRDL